MSNMVALTFELYEENIALQKENEKLRAAIDRVRALHAYDELAAENADLRAELVKAQKERDSLVSEYEGALGITPTLGYLHALLHIRSAVLNGNTWKAVADDLTNTLMVRDRECDDLRAAIDRVLELHAPETRLFSVRDRACIVCRDEDGTPMEHPCPTIRAVDGDDA